MRAAFRSGGEQIALDCRQGFLSEVLREGLVGEQTQVPANRPDIRVTVEDSTRPFDTHDWDVLTRNAWRRPGEVLLRDACSSGIDLLVAIAGPSLEIRARWRPPPVGRAAAAILRSRSRLLIRAVLLQYPALWWGQQREELRCTRPFAALAQTLGDRCSLPGRAASASRPSSTRSWSMELWLPATTCV